jgi:LmbE family N-acetylglucosaminyl deacetylase
VGCVLGSRAARGRGADEARASAEEFLEGVRWKEIRIGSLPESYFPSEWSAIEDWLNEICATFDPQLVFTHYRYDRHQDHRVLSDLAWNTFRNHLILEYKILKYDGDLGSPNLFVPLSAEIGARKVELLLKHFQTQRSKHWFTADPFEAMQRIGGVESASSFHQSGIL